MLLTHSVTTPHIQPMIGSLMSHVMKTNQWEYSTAFVTILKHSTAAGEQFRFCVSPRYPSRCLYLHKHSWYLIPWLHGPIGSKVFSLHILCLLHESCFMRFLYTRVRVAGVFTSFLITLWYLVADILFHAPVVVQPAVVKVDWSNSFGIYKSFYRAVRRYYSS